MNRRDRFQRAELLFRAARDMPVDQRSAFLAAECVDQTTLLEEVDGMLRADAKPSGVLDAAARVEGMSIADFVLTASTAERALPKRIGRYEIVRVLGSGGMGVVYEARQENPRRSVALKVMHAGLVSPRALQRFQHEAQVLGRLQDSGIAQVFEAGIDDWGEGEQPYFVMEFVAGKPLLEFVQQSGIGTRERIALLAKICDIVHSAHQKGVIHRDLKPANILVLERAAEDPSSLGSASQDLIAAQPKILDFGIARVLDPDHVATLQTNAGQILGTVPYMSPEQAAGDSALIDIRSDVYSLGVISFEVLSGTLPHDVRHKPLHEALHIVSAQDAPRLGGRDRALRGDIEAVVAKALEKEPARRYASAAEMAADLRRILRHESIQARRPNVLDQVVKLARRNRGIVAAALLAVAALIAVTVVSLRLASLAAYAEMEQRSLRGIADERSADARRQSYRLALAAAASSLRFNEVNNARRQLEAAPKELRGFEWDHLWSRLDDTVGAFDGPTGAAAVAFTPDGSALIVASLLGTVHRWDVDPKRKALTNRLDATFAQPVPHFRDVWARSIRFASDGRKASILTRGGMTVVDRHSLAVISQRQHLLEVFGISDDGWAATSVSTGDWNELHVERGPDERLTLPCLPIESHAEVAKFSDDGRLVAICDGSRSGLSVYDLASRTRVFHRPDITWTKSLAFSPDATRLAVATTGLRSYVARLDRNETDVVLDGHQASVIAITLSADGRSVATASDDYTIRVWDADTGVCRSVLNGCFVRARSIAFSPDGSTLATLAGDNVIRLWSTAMEREPFTSAAPATVYSIDFSADGKRLVSGSLGGTQPVRVWDVASALELAAGGEGFVSAVAFDADGKRIAVGRSHADDMVIGADDLAPLATIPGHWWRTDWIAFPPGGQQVISLGNSGTLRVHDAATGVLRRGTNMDDKDSNLGCRARLSPGGAVLVASHRADALIIDPATLQVKRRLVGHSEPIHAIVFSADGARLATGSDDHTVRVWDMANGECLAVLTGHTEGVYAVAFAPDGRRIASGGADRLIRIWDTERFDELVSLRGHTSFVYCLEFSPDGRCLVSGGGDATIRWWDTRPLREVVAARSAQP